MSFIPHAPPRSVTVSLGGTYTEATVYDLLLMVIQTATACKAASN